MTVQNLTNHPIHPWYGPCDALGNDGECCECQRVAREVNADLERFRAERAVLTAEVARLTAELRPIADAARRETEAERRMNKAIFDDSMPYEEACRAVVLASVARRRAVEGGDE